MTDVVRVVDGDALGLQWPGAEPHWYRPGDERAAALAFVKAVRDGVVRGETPEEDTARDVARLAAAQLGVTKDASGDLIVAWWVPQDLAEKLAIPGGVAAADMHLTLLYLGDPAQYEDLDLLAALLKIKASRTEPLEGLIGGMGRFVGAGDTDAVVALCDVPELDDLRECIEETFKYDGRLPMTSPVWNEQHGFVPHITLGYLSKTQASPPPYTETVPIEIDNLTLAAGANRVSFELQENAAPEAPDYPVAMATWSAAYINGLPDSSFAYIAPGGKKDSEGKTTPRDLRHLPFRDENGNVDLPHVRAGLSRLGDPSNDLGGMSDAKRKSIIAKFEKLLQAAQKSMRDLLDGGPVYDDDPAEVVAADDPDLAYVVTKATAAKRYTLGPLYAPVREDAHGEWTDADTLQEAVWDYVRMSSEDERQLRLQHGDGEVTVGEWVEIMAWPYDHTIKIRQPGEAEREIDMPAGTVYMGVVWKPEFWDEAAGAPKGIGGYSLGGKAVKVATTDTFAPMGDRT